MIDLDAVKRVDWQSVVNRPESPLFRSYSVLGHSKYFEESTKLPWKSESELFVNKDICFSKNKLTLLEKLIQERQLADSAFFRSFGERIVEYCEKLKETALKLSKKGFQDKELQELKDDFVLFSEIAGKTFAFLLPMPLADRIMSNLIREELQNILSPQEQDHLEDYFKILTYPVKMNTHSIEEIEFLSIVESIQKDRPLKQIFLQSNVEDRLDSYSQIKEKLQSHLEKFGWIGARNWWFENTWTISDFIERIAILLEHNVTEEKRHIKEIREKNQRDCDRVLRHLGNRMTSNFLSIIESAKEYAYLRTYRTDTLHYLGYLVKNLLYAIGKQIGIGPTDIVLLGTNEIQKSFEKGSCVVSIATIEERKRDFGTLTLEGKFQITSGNDLEEIKNFIQSQFKATPQDKVTGTVAYADKIIGVAKIVHSANDLYKIKKGDVLIAAMTLPNYIMAMEKAVAFVTDEGGILCHAAIISREMQKPCIIGTKIATKIFKDGEVIEVDANKGVVRKL